MAWRYQQKTYGSFYRPSSTLDGQAKKVDTKVGESSFRLTCRVYSKTLRSFHKLMWYTYIHWLASVLFRLACYTISLVLFKLCRALHTSITPHPKLERARKLGDPLDDRRKFESYYTRSHIKVGRRTRGYIHEHARRMIFTTYLADSHCSDGCCFYHEFRNSKCRMRFHTATSSNLHTLANT